MTLSTQPEIVDLGRAPFDEVHEQMLSLAETIRQGGSVGKILLVEHEPVYTAGRATPSEELPPEIRSIERGGRITYHGPGQLVVYPILLLPQRDVRSWIRALERFGIAVCASFDLRAEASVDGTGVFVNGKKVASIGVAIRHWINLHGICINVAMDLSAYDLVRPCGLDPSVMYDLSTATGRPVAMEEARRAVRDEVFLLLESQKSCK